jgi:hypothetical protein
LRLRVLIYNGTRNLGDAIQTHALCRLHGLECDGVYRDLPFPEADDDTVLVVYGWLGGWIPDQTPRCVISGIHLGWKRDSYVAWLQRLQQPIGARDPDTQRLLTANQLDSTMIGCATLTLDRYNGPRTGRLSIDVEPRAGTVALTNRIVEQSWSNQWQLAAHRLEQLRTAAVVYTSRLHVVLPCLAFGTPGVFPREEYEKVRGKGRLTLLEHLGFEYDVPVQIDVSAWADRYCRFLSEGLQAPLQPATQPRMPIPLPYADVAQLLQRLAPVPVARPGGKE